MAHRWVTAVIESRANVVEAPHCVCWLAEYIASLGTDMAARRREVADPRE